MCENYDILIKTTLLVDQAALLFYQYLSEKKKDFLWDHDYSDEEILDGAKQVLQKAGYGDIVKVMEQNYI